MGEFKAGLYVGEWLSERTLRPRWNKVKHLVAPWGRELSQNAAKYAIIDLGQASDAWGGYRGRVKGRVKAGHRPGRRVGFPRFKRRKHEQGFRADNGPDTIRVDGKVVMLPKIGHVAMVEELRFGGSIREVTINRTAGTWFACFCIEDGQPVPPVKSGPTIGVDVGVGTLAVCSNGLQVENPKALNAAIRRLRRVDKAIARSINGHGRSNHSNRRERLYAKRRRVHARIVNARNDNHHKATTAIAKSAGRVVVRDTERGWDDDESPLGSGDWRRWDGRVSDQAGIQVRVVWRRAREGGPVVPVVEAVRSLRLAQRRTEVVGASMVVRWLWCAERAGLQCGGEFG